MPNTLIRRAVVGVAASAALVLAGAAAAQAHVRVIPESEASGAYPKLTFRVPTESETASTTRVSISLPTATPLVFVSAQAVDGWTIKIDTGKLPQPVTLEGTTLTEATTKVTWTATKGHEVGPGQFAEFSISGGPLPAAGTELDFPAEQTYSDGTVVKWVEPQPAGAAEPEHPVPSFKVTAAESEEGASSDTSTTALSASAGPGPESSDDSARLLGGAGLIAGLAALVLGALAYRRSGRGAA
jgi:uncharacterized protein YcnI